MPADWWTTPDLLQALARRDVGHLFRMIQKITKASQTQIGMATGLSQAQVSEIMSGKRQVTTLDVAARIIEGLQMPDPARTVLLLGHLDHAATRQNDPRSPLYRCPPQNAMPPPHPAVNEMADVERVYPTRAEFAAAMPPNKLFENATDLRIAGLSLNTLCQHYGDRQLLRLLQSGASIRCLFLDPDGESIRTREREEGHQEGFLSSLTRLNIDTLVKRVRDHLDQDHASRLQVATYDEIIRFNIMLVDNRLCVAQPYLPGARGIDAPTLVIRHHPDMPEAGLYGTFEQVFDSMWERARPL